jgi:two-component system NtrC family sensor kinase
MLALQIEKKNVHILEELPPGLPLIMADEHQLHQVFLNLILNALQATDAGDTVEIRTRHLSDEKQIEIVFSDTGMGIPVENMKKVFNPFFTTKEEGTGLGLSVVSKIIENHHGKIFLTSSVEKGARFAIRLPVAEQFETAPYKDIVSS